MAVPATSLAMALTANMAQSKLATSANTRHRLLASAARNSPSAALQGGRRGAHSVTKSLQRVRWVQVAGGDDSGHSQPLRTCFGM